MTDLLWKLKKRGRWSPVNHVAVQLGGQGLVQRPTAVVPGSPPFSSVTCCIIIKSGILLLIIVTIIFTLNHLLQSLILVHQHQPCHMVSDLLFSHSVYVPNRVSAVAHMFSVVKSEWLT